MAVAVKKPGGGLPEPVTDVSSSDGQEKITKSRKHFVLCPEEERMRVQ